MFNHFHWQWLSYLLPGYAGDQICRNGVRNISCFLWHTGHLTESCSPRATSACQSSAAQRGSAQSAVQTVGQLAEGRNWDRVHCRLFTRAEEGENFRWGWRDICSLSRPWIGAQFNYNAPQTWARRTVAANCKRTQTVNRQRTKFEYCEAKGPKCLKGHFLILGQLTNQPTN